MKAVTNKFMMFSHEWFYLVSTLVVKNIANNMHWTWKNIIFLSSSFEVIAYLAYHGADSNRHNDIIRGPILFDLGNLIDEEWSILSKNKQLIKMIDEL